MKKSVFWLIMISMVLVSWTPAFGAGSVQLLVGLKPGAAAPAWPAGVAKALRLSNSPVYILTVAADAAGSVASQLKSLPETTFVETSTQNPIPHGLNQFEALSGATDWQSMIDLPGLQRLSMGSGAVVALIDTGVDFTNSTFSGNLLSTGYNFGDDNSDPQDQYGHGSEVCSLILETAPECRILPIKIDSGSSPTFSTAALVQALDFAVSAKVQVINLSLTLDSASDAVTEAVQAAIDAGIVVVVAVGNDPSAIAFPATIDGVVAVGALYTADEPASWFSPEGSGLDEVAPGVEITVTGLGGVQSLETGTSFSCAMVSGAAALLRAMNPHLTGTTAASQLNAGAKDLGDPDWDPVFGYGALNGAYLLPAVSGQVMFPGLASPTISGSSALSLGVTLPETDTATNVYLAVEKDGVMLWSDGQGIWHDASAQALAPMGTVPLSAPVQDFTLFGTNGLWPAIALSGLPIGTYQFAVGMTDASGALLAPITWQSFIVY